MSDTTQYEGITVIAGISPNEKSQVVQTVLNLFDNPNEAQTNALSELASSACHQGDMEESAVVTMIETLRNANEELVPKKGIVILSKPEASLHPHWQIILAELLVLLQKHTGVKMSIEANSHMFIDALDIFSYEYGTQKTTHFYLQEQTQGKRTMTHANKQMDAIYALTAKVVSKLRSRRLSMQIEHQNKNT